jgi:hypothetical protein
MNISRHLQSFDPRIAIAVFVAYLLIDAMYAYYTLAITRRQPVAAATVGSLMYVLIAFGILNFVENYLYVIPMVIGSWIGTYVVVKREMEEK